MEDRAMSALEMTAEAVGISTRFPYFYIYMHICIPSSWFCIISLKARAGGFGGGGGGCNGGGGGGGYIGGRSSRTIYCILGDIYNILYIGILGDIYLGKVTQTTLLNTK